MKLKYYYQYTLIQYENLRLNYCPSVAIKNEPNKICARRQMRRRTFFFI